MKKKRLLIGFLFLCLLFPFGTSAFAYTDLVAFGDSLSDNGGADGFGFGVFSDGPVWVDYLASSLGVGLLDMAYGGARTNYNPDPSPGGEMFGFGWQIDTYINTINGGTVDNNALYTIWIGGNDLLNLGDGPTPSEPVAAITNAVTNIAAGIGSLIDAGAENILLVNMPNLGIAPLFNGQNLAYGYPFMDNPDGAELLAENFNYALDFAVDPFRSGINLFEVDIFTMMEEWIAYGLFDDYTHMLQVNLPTTDSYMFWDAIHPTTYMHSLIAEAAFNEVAPVPEPSTMLLVGAGLIGLVGVRRKLLKK